ncbi:MAG: tetratricopeptide repeat protein [Chitinispirillales bacterium]|nr:tetratricopeptide repeat protein [Chitinispirillales bacterium]
MDIKKKKNSQPVGDDPLIGGLIKAKAYMSKNGTILLVCVAAVAVVIIGAFTYSRMREASISRAQEIFGVGVLDYNADRFDDALDAFSKAANSYRNTPIGAMSAFMAGSIYLQQRQDADQAIVWFEMALSGGDIGFVRGQANEGLATAYEKKGDIANAIRHLERALRDRNMAHRHPAIRWRLALLNKDSNPSATMAYSRELIADTLASTFHQRAENLLAALNAGQ